MTSGSDNNHRPVRVVVWAAVAALVVLKLGPAFVGVFRPQTSDTYTDFVQEWISARNFWNGYPVYEKQRDAILRMTGKDTPEFDEALAWNAHPPVAILVSLPFGLITDYRAAHLAWNLATFTVFLVTVSMILIELRVRWHWWSVFPAIVLLVANYPVNSQLWQGQLNFPLVFLLVSTWMADRRGYRLLAGITLGLAIAFKLFPALLLIYFVATRNWRSFGIAIVTAMVANGLALALFRWGAYETYIRDVIPSLEIFRGSWGNASATGYMTRLCRAAGMPGLAATAAIMCQLAIVVTISVVAWRARSTADRDRAFALAIAGLPLASPISWTHYFVLLALPLSLLWQRLPAGWTRIAFAMALVLLLLPEAFYAGIYRWLVPGSPDVVGLANHLPTPPDLGLCAIGLAFPTIALVTIFLLLAFTRLEPPDATAVEPAQVEP